MGSQSFQLALVVSYGLALLWMGVVLWRGPHAARQAQWTRQHASILIALLACWLIFVGEVPHAPWQTNFHGLGRVAGVEDVGWTSPLGQGAVHGTGWIACMRLWFAATGGLLTVFHLNIFAAALAGAAGAVWVSVALRDVPAAMGFTLALALSPVWLRMAPTVSPYVLCTSGLMVALASGALYRRSGHVGDLVCGCLSVMLVMNLHAELVVLGPAIILGGWWACGLSWRDRRLGIALVVLMLFAIYRLGGVSGWLAYNGGQAGVLARSLDLAAAPARAPVLRGGALLMALAVMRLGWGQESLSGRSLPRWSWVLFGGMAVLAEGWFWQSGYDPESPPLPLLWPDLAYLHPYLHLGYTPVHVLVMTGVGLAVLWLVQLRWFVWLSLTLAALLAFYAGRVDAFATWVRTGLMAAAIAGLAGGLGWATTYRALTRQWSGAWVAAGLMIWGLWGSSGRAGWVLFRFPMQQEFELLDDLRRGDFPGRLATLRSDDQPEGALPGHHDLAVRSYVDEILTRRQDKLVSMRDTEREAPDWYLRGLGCFRAVMPVAGAAEPRTMILGGRAWWLPPRGVDARPLPLDNPWRRVYRSQRRWTIETLVPCWDAPDEIRCALQGDSTCAAWSCDDASFEREAASYLDPACAAFESAWILEEVAGFDVHGGQSSQSWSTVPQATARVALFRVLGRKSRR